MRARKLLRIGSYGASTGAKTETSTTNSTSTAPATNDRLRTSLCTNGPASRTTSLNQVEPGSIVALLKAHPRVGDGVEDVDEQINQQVDRRDEQQRALDHRKIAAEHSTDDQPPDPGQREHLLDHHRPAEQRAGYDAEHGQDRHQR